MQNSKGIRIVDIVYNPVQEKAFLTFSAFPDSRPDDHAHFWFTGPYCELRRSPREHIIFKMRSRQVLEVLRKAREVFVSETKDDKVIWNYSITKINNYDV